MKLSKKQVMLRCPYCNMKQGLSGMQKHVVAKHPEIPQNRIEKDLIKMITSGEMKPIIFEKPDSSIVSATERVNQAKHGCKSGITQMVSGGKVG